MLNLMQTCIHLSSIVLDSNKTITYSIYIKSPDTANVGKDWDSL